MKFSRLNESLDWIAQANTPEAAVARAKNIMERDSTFIQYMVLAVDPNQKINLPEGVPEQYRPKYDLPDGVSDTVLKAELRRIKNFLPSGSINHLDESKRILLWVNMLEGLHWKEAEVLTHIKDQNLLEVYPQLEEVLLALDILPNSQKSEVEVKNEDETVINTTTTEAPITTAAPTTEAPSVPLGADAITQEVTTVPEELVKPKRKYTKHAQQESE